MVLAIDCLPNRKPSTYQPKSIPVYQYQKTLKDEIAAGLISRTEALSLYEQMCAIRAVEEMIYELRSGAYACLAGKFQYVGPTHLSVGQEATAVGVCSILNWDDYITSTHRGHGESMAKVYAAILAMDRKAMDARVAFYQIPVKAGLSDEELRQQLIDDHLYRFICELFGKEHGYCKGRGGSMHIADFSCGHLGANAIVGGGTPIATGAAWASRYLEDGRVTVCFAGDGAFCNGASLESLQLASMPQFANGLMDKKFGTPVIFALTNNLYAMTGQSHGELCDIPFMAARALGFSESGMQAEVVDGMDILAVRESMRRAMAEARAGRGPILRELRTYRYYGHSLSDPRKAYRTKEEEEAWRAVDPLITFRQQIAAAGVASEADCEAIYRRAVERNAAAAVRAAASPDPSAKALYEHLYTTSTSELVPAAHAKLRSRTPIEKPKRDSNGLLTYKDAIKEALIEEMARDARVIFFGEDVADYGGAFFVTDGLLKMFGRDRVFNTSISEAGICGCAVGAAMAGCRPVAELMYMDFALMASDQISNQGAKWHYMSGGMRTVPMVLRVSVGGGKGYGGQHSQSIESMFTHIPGLRIAIPATPYDAKGLFKTAIRDDNPVMFLEGQLLYGLKGKVPEDDYTIPFGQAAIRKAGKDCTFVGWSYVVNEAVKAAEILERDHKISMEVIDARTLIPFDYATVLASARKTGRVLVGSQAVRISSFTAEVADTIQREAFDHLDAPIVRIGAADSVNPQAQAMEQAYLPSVASIVAETVALMKR